MRLSRCAPSVLVTSWLCVAVGCSGGDKGGAGGTSVGSPSGGGGAAGSLGGGDSSGVGGAASVDASADSSGSMGGFGGAGGSMPDAARLADGGEVTRDADASVADGGTTLMDGSAILMDGPAGFPDAPGCASFVQPAQVRPGDLLFLVDRSGSMFCPIGAAGDTCISSPPTTPPPNRWSSIVDALSSFAAAPTFVGIRMGLGFFPPSGGPDSGVAECNPASYGAPVLPIQPLPSGAANIAAALAARAPDTGSTPTTPALQGATQYARTQMAFDPSLSMAVVLITDGIPNGCFSTLDNAAAAAGLSWSTQSPPVRTYVIGVGPALAGLDPIAAAGGTTGAHLVDTDGDVPTQLAAALDAISRSATCDYALPSTGNPLDLNQINVQLRIGSGDAVIPSRVSATAACGEAGGWYYDNALSPTKLTLCPATCTAVNGTPGSAVRFIVGCGTIVQP